MFLIISIFNNKDKLDKYLMPSLKKQNIEYDLILIDNRNSKYTSAASAYNKNIIDIKNKYIMFVHQDVSFEDDFLKNTKEMIEKISHFGVIGIAGKRRNSDGVITNITHGLTKKHAGRKKISIPQKVQTVDECCFIIPKNIYCKTKFDSVTCDDWHLYCVDYCLTSLKNGNEVYVIPANLYHASTGIKNKHYYKTLNKLVIKYRKDFDSIYTTTGNWSTSKPILLQRLIKKTCALFKRGRVLCQ